MPGLIRPAALRQINDEIERHSTWLELFFDLIFVVIVTEVGVRLAHDFTYLGILKCMALFIPVMWTWVSYTVFAARFDNDDLAHWIMTFVIMFAGIIMAIQIPTALETGSFGFATGFLIAQASLLLLYSRAIYDDSAPKNMILLYELGFGLGTAFWFLSLFFEPPTRLIFWFSGMLIYLLVPWVGKKRILSKAPLDTIYIPERFGLFTIIVLGQTIASVVFGLKFAHWNFYSAITSIMAFVLAIVIWSQYYRFTRMADYKCTLSSGQSYIYGHVPLIIGIMLMGVCAEFYIKTPTVIDTKVNIVFCFAAILYLSSFYLLQYIAFRKFRVRGISFILGIIGILLIFLSHTLLPYAAISGLVFIFMILFSIQFWLGTRHPKTH